MLKLPNVTLIGIDCVDVERLQNALNISSEKIQFGKIKLLTSLTADDIRKVEIPHIGSKEEYSKFCISELTKYVDTDYVLIVQYDGFVLNPSSWREEFLNYDYIGAPWFMRDNTAYSKYYLFRKLFAKPIVGNGGFSLRSKKFLDLSKKLFDEKVLDKYHPEDVAICLWYKENFEKAGIKFAPINIAKKFSIESGDFRYKKQFGFHGSHKTNISKWIKKNPQWKVNAFQ